MITETGDAWPSGRIRALIYKDLLTADGVEVRYVSRRVPWLTRLTGQPGRLTSRVMDAGFGRVLSDLSTCLARAREASIVRIAQDDYDAIYLQKVASFSLVSALRQSTRARLVYDLNDGVWLPSRAAFADGQVREILRTVDAVTCDNPYGLEFARPYNSSLFLVADPPQVELFDEYRTQIPKPGSPVVLGWVGSAATLFNLYAIWEPLEALFARYEDIALRLVGTGYDRRLLPPFEGVRFSVVPFYSQRDMVREVLRMDIGLFPLFDVEDSLARGVLKATIFMSGEVCLVTRPIGQNRDLLTDGYNAVFANASSEWLEKLTELLEDVSRRRQIARAGLETVREKFTLRCCYQQLRVALEGEVSGGANDC